MTRLDLFIQTYRIRTAEPFISKSARVLDIGCGDGALFRQLPYLRGGIGIDPDISTTIHLPNADLISGYFPAGLPGSDPYDVITLLAVLEHLPEKAQAALARDCFDYLKSEGRIIITVPSPAVDKVLAVLTSLRLMHGTHVEQHYGFDPRQTPGLFQSAGFQLVCAKKFEFGLNNLFVFAKP
jgi:SAM-dependent methyltransferase